MCPLQVETRGTGFFSGADSKVRTDACVSFTSTRHFRARRRGRARWTVQRTWAETPGPQLSTCEKTFPPTHALRLCVCALPRGARSPRQNSPLSRMSPASLRAPCLVHTVALLPRRSCGSGRAQAATPSSPTGTDVPL